MIIALANFIYKKNAYIQIILVSFIILLPLKLVKKSMHNLLSEEIRLSCK